MEAEWLTYREAAKRLGSNIEAVRQRAIRCRWPRTIGNDKRARIQIPDGLTDPSQEENEKGSREGNDRPPRGADERAYDRAYGTRLIKSLEAHVETLKEQLAAAEARLVELDARHAAEIAGERARAEKQAAESVERDARQTADLAAERAQTAKAIEAFRSLAERLDALAAERGRPWWRRLPGIGRREAS
jgi:hypothetical protein